MAPQVTIGVPTYDRLAYLKEAVASALAQTCPNIEVLISDDGPSEATRAWAVAQAASDRRVRYQHTPRNLGLAGNWNEVVAAAQGEMVVIIGDDDRLLPGFVARLLQAVNDADVVFSNHYLIDAEGRRLEEQSRSWTRTYHRDSLQAGLVADPAIVVWQNAVPMCAALVRTEVARRLRFKDDLNTPEIELFARLAQEGGCFSFVPEYLVEHRIHRASYTARGLFNERLVKYLAPIPVSPHVEPEKRRFMEPLLVSAVSRVLVQGDVSAARSFLRSAYYPHSAGRVAVWLQRVCVVLPLGGAALYRTLVRLRRRLC